MSELTDSKCRNTKPTNKIQKLFDGGGLFLKITTQGKKYWYLKYRFGGKEKLLSFGEYPLTTLSDARQKRANAKKLISENKDPSLIRKIEKQKISEDHENTFEKIAREWHTKQESKLSPSYWKEKLNRLERDIFPIFGKFPITEIKPLTVLKAIEAIENRNAIEMAKRTLQICKTVFNYAIATGRLEYNPSIALQGGLKSQQTTHYASIEIAEIPNLLKAIDQNKCRLFPSTVNALKMMMLVFVRTGELIKAEWKEFNFKENMWIIPKKRMKKKKQDHLVPLSKQVLEILEDQKRYANPRNDYVFPSAIKDHNHMSNNTLLKALDKLGYKHRMTGHGFRSLAMTTIIERLKYDPRIPDLQLAHIKKDKVEAAYNRSEMIEERIKMMQEWADYIENIG